MIARTCTILLVAIITSARSLNDPSLATVYDKCVVNNTVALTFDDGPYIYMTNVSDLLTKHNAKGTFFVNDCIYAPDVVGRLRYTYNAGHQICSHTWSHPNLKSLNAQQITTEITRLDKALLDVLSIKTPFLRPPYGNYNNLVRQTAKKNSKSLVVWDFDSGDSVGETWEQSEIDYNAIIAKHPQTLLALYLLPTVIPRLQAAGYKLVTLAECLGLEPYTFVGSFGPRDATYDNRSSYRHTVMIKASERAPALHLG
ncbi:carbohydrate esterase family 4 protein [Mycena leptocephala]|nr:carbohydrate esterase family 4 protein [Mycena leptocephala]